MTTGSPNQHYHRKTIWLHWLTAALVVLLWLSAQFIDYFPKGPSRWNMLGVHMSMGVALLVIMIQRIQWRRRPSSGSEPVSSTLARGGHVLLYVVVLVVIALGFANAWVRGEWVFNFFQLPAFDPGNKPLRKAAGEVHQLAAYAILALGGLHGVVALFHQFVLRDRLMERMLRASVK